MKISIDTKDLFKKVKEYCERDFADLDRCFKNPYLMMCMTKKQLVQQSMDRSFGIIMFVANQIVGYDDTAELLDWWENDMLHRYYNKRQEVGEE